MDSSSDFRVSIDLRNEVRTTLWSKAWHVFGLTDSQLDDLVGHFGHVGGAKAVITAARDISDQLAKVDFDAQETVYIGMYHGITL